jgi:hypothetical protein
LFIYELFAHSKKYQATKFAFWIKKERLLKMCRPSLKVSSLECLKIKYVFQFCIIYCLPIAQMFLVTCLVGFFERCCMKSKSEKISLQVEYE